MMSGRLADLYAEHHRRGARYGYIYGGEHRLRLFGRWLDTAGRVLDLGCRDGTLAARLMLGRQCVGVDIDLHALAAARAVFPLGVVQGNLNTPLPFRAASFDAVLAGELVEHLVFPGAFLGEVARVLRPGGRFIGSTPNAFRLRNRWRFLLGKEFDPDPTHLHWFSPAGLQRLLLGYFRRICIEPVGGHFLGGGRRGVPVTMGAPLCLRRLFALDLCWLAEDPIGASAG